MGLLTKIATLPLAPVWGVTWVARRLTEYAEDEVLGQAGIRRRLAEIEAASAVGELSDEERERAEQEALAPLGELIDPPEAVLRPDARRNRGGQEVKH